MTVAAPTIETERLILRGWCQEDLDPLAAFYETDPGAIYVGGRMTKFEAWRRLAAFSGHWQLKGFGLFALQEKRTGDWVGWTGLWNPPEFPEIELGYALIERARGQGLVTEAGRAARQYAYQQVKLSTLVSFIVPENTASARVAERLGCAREGHTEIRGFKVGVWRHPPPSTA